MPRYSAFVDDVLAAPDLLQKLTPKEPLNWHWPGKISAAPDETLTGGAVVKNATFLALARGGLLYAVDDLDAAHRFFQDDPSPAGSYWHGMMHRREGDFDNARYWFRRVGRLGSLYQNLHAEAGRISAVMGRQSTWDPYLLSGQCEQAKFGDTEIFDECLRLQRLEFDAVFEHCWRAAVGG